MKTKNTKLAAEIEKALNDTAAQLALGGKWTDKKWTKGVKDTLVGLGNRENDENRCKGGYVTCASSCDSADDGEWLYDVCWLNYEDNDRKGGTNPLINIALAAESEWNAWGVDDDFTKLIFARADFRVFVCWTKNTERRKKLVNHLKTLVAQSRATSDDDEYLIACGDWDTERFGCEHFTGAEAKQ